MKFHFASLAGKKQGRVVELYRLDQLLKLAVEFDHIIIAPPDKNNFYSRSEEHPTVLVPYLKEKK